MKVQDLPDKITEPFATLVPQFEQNYYGANTCNWLGKRALYQSYDEYNTTIVEAKPRGSGDTKTYSVMGGVLFQLYTTYEEFIKHKFDRKYISVTENLTWEWQQYQTRPISTTSQNNNYVCWFIKGEDRFVNTSPTENNSDHPLPFERCCYDYEKIINGTNYKLRPVWRSFNKGWEGNEEPSHSGEEFDLEMVELYETQTYQYDSTYGGYIAVWENFLGIWCIGHVGGGGDMFYDPNFGVTLYEEGIDFFAPEDKNLADFEIKIRGKTFLGYCNSDKSGYYFNFEGKVTREYHFWDYDIN